MTPITAELDRLDALFLSGQHPRERDGLERLLAVLEREDEDRDGDRWDAQD